MPAPTSSRTRARAAADTAEGPFTGLLDHLSVVPDPRRPQGIRYPLPAILAMVFCAMSGTGHDGASAAVEWAHRADDALLMRLGLRFDPVTGRVPVPTERTVAGLLAGLDPHTLAAAGAAHAEAIAAHTGPTLNQNTANTPDDVPERAHRRQRSTPAARPRQACLAADGKAMRGSRGADGTRAGVFHLARHSNSVVTAARAIGAKHTERAFRGLMSPSSQGLDKARWPESHWWTIGAAGRTSPVRSPRGCRG